MLTGDIAGNNKGLFQSQTFFERFGFSSMEGFLKWVFIKICDPAPLIGEFGPENDFIL